MQLENGWIVGVTRVVSPHCDRRPDDEPPSLLVIHNISLPPGEFGGPYIDQLFTGTLDPAQHPYFAEIHQLRVSAHCLIRRDGEIVQYVPFDQRAWHAGVSLYQGRERCNDFSIGIELEGTDQLAYTEAQYRTLQAVTSAAGRTLSAVGGAYRRALRYRPRPQNRSRAGVRLGSLSGISGTTRRARRRYA